MGNTKSAAAAGGYLPGPDRRALSGWFIATLCVTAWTVLWAWSASPYARYVAHGGWLDAGAFAEICRAIPAGAILVPAGRDTQAS